MLEKNSNIRSYFNESMFVDGIVRPEGANAAPKTDTDQDQNTGYKYTSMSYGTKKFDVESVSPMGDCIKGSFLVYEEKAYNYYWDKEKEKCEEFLPMTFKMYDSGMFESNITVLDSENVAVNTKTSVVRYVKGCNYNGKSVRDGMFAGLKHENCSAAFEYNEYYKVIANGKRLLHYSDCPDFFEVYELPKGWKSDDGVSNLGYPKVFDDFKYDKNDKDLDEIKSILSEKTNNNSEVLVKKINNSH